MEENYRKLPDSIQRKGQRYSRIHTEEKYYIYEQFSEFEGEFKSVAFEVWTRKIVKPHPNDQDQSLKEGFPSDESFGKWAWTYPTIEEAMKKIEERKDSEASYTTT